MVAFAVVLRAFVEVVFELPHRVDHFVGVNRARVFNCGEHTFDTGITQRAIVGRNRTRVGFAIAIIQRLGAWDGVLKPPVVRRTANHAVKGLRATGDARGVKQHRRDQFGCGFEAKVCSLFDRVEQVAAEVAEAQDIGLERLNAGQK